ncbi:hypothetical protein CUW_2202 [Turicibacter sanguinis PC909]|uniref:Cyclic nucleotide-binding domain-containing protein n=1 Tax=Turicibacter sanguinis PC909 TaxID=702450 RepID=A0ABP2I3A3_9FIRM|nr:ParB N-terminal domain-containing protein [Turicibacter sanguinis]EFF64568.1 hypothetical protein CUW_2202 [Turicibacter sanguinis PC909]MDB8545752.1 hypothetical protein [Turicibacter sanguinis]CUO24653.1 ParB/RepB/Spo0J family partition protein [Turicibacter sanguinis]
MGIKSNVMIRDELLCIDNILLDPLNPRFITKGREYKISEFKNKNIQLELIEKLRNYRMKELIDSILENGFLSLERVAVVRLEEGSNNYVVIEGNRRIAAIKLIMMDKTIDFELRNSLMNVNVCIIAGKVYENSQEERYKIASLSHLSGKVEWEDYQKAIFLHDIVTQCGKKCKEAGTEIGLGRNRAIAMFQAYKAYKSIQRLEWYHESEEENYRDEDYFPFFYEAMRIGSIKDEYFKVVNDVVCKPENLKNFCTWIGLTTHKKIIDRQIKYKEQIKDLKIVLQDPVAREALEGGESLEVAIQLVRLESINHKKTISDFLSYLKKIPENYLEIISKQDKDNLNKIGRELGKILNKKFK